MEASTSENSTSSDLEGGISLVRTGDEATRLRNRLERPARIGRYLLGGLGAVTAAAGVATWITNGSLVGLALGIFGVLLIALALIQQLLLRRDQQHWPDQAVLREDGIELFLHNGEVRGHAWTDPDLALNLVSRRAPAPADREYLMVWMSDLKIPSIELSAEGYECLTRAAEAQHLNVKVNRRGRGRVETQVVEIRQGAQSVHPAPRPSVEAPSHQE